MPPQTDVLRVCPPELLDDHLNGKLLPLRFLIAQVRQLPPSRVSLWVFLDQCKLCLDDGQLREPYLLRGFPKLVQSLARLDGTAKPGESAIEQG
jgi:hypothetical protein